MKFGMTLKTAPQGHTGPPHRHTENVKLGKVHTVADRPHLGPLKAANPPPPYPSLRKDLLIQVLFQESPQTRLPPHSFLPNLEPLPGPVSPPRPPLHRLL